MTLYAHDSMFSPKAPDRGTLAMLQCTEIKSGDKLLDLGCGTGIVGIYAAKLIGGKNVVMTDSSSVCAEYAKRNAELNGVPEITVFCGDGYQNVIDRDFTLILSNPPYHTDFSVAKAFIEDGYRRLVFGGKMVMVTKRLDWYKNKLTKVFGGVNVKELDGYCIFTAEKRPERTRPSDIKNRRNLSKKLERKLKRRTRH